MAKSKKKAAKGKAISKASRKARRPAKAAKKAAKGASKAKAKPKPAKAKAKPAKAKAKPAKAKPAKAKAKPAKAKPPAKSAKPAAKKAKAAPAPKTQGIATKLVKAAAKLVKAALAPKADKVAAKPSKPRQPKPEPAVSAEPAPQAPQAPRIEVGSRAPAFTLKDQSGAALSSAELSGKPYVLYFYPKDDTSGCTAEACGFRDSGPKFGELGVRVIGVSPDSEASHQKFAGKYGLPFTLLSDPEKQLIQAYGAWVEKQNYGRTYMGVQRSTFLVGADGTVRKAWRSVKVPGHVDAVLAATQS